MLTQKDIDRMSDALRSQGLTWNQTNFAVSLVRNSVDAERNLREKIMTFEEWKRLRSALGKNTPITPEESWEYAVSVGRERSNDRALEVVGSTGGLGCPDPGRFMAVTSKPHAQLSGEMANEIKALLDNA